MEALTNFYNYITNLFTSRRTVADITRTFTEMIEQLDEVAEERRKSRDAKKMKAYAFLDEADLDDDEAADAVIISQKIKALVE